MVPVVRTGGHGSPVVMGPAGTGVMAAVLIT